MKDGEIPTIIPQRNPITYAAHRRQIFWQIYFPLTIFILVIVGLALLAIFADEQGKSLWADISIIYLSAFMMLFALILSIVIITLVYFLHQGLRLLPYQTIKAQAFFFRVNMMTRDATNKSVEPFIRVGSYMAGMKALFRRSR